jgi:hypothetical protein
MILWLILLDNQRQEIIIEVYVVIIGTEHLVIDQPGEMKGVVRVALVLTSAFALSVSPQNNRRGVSGAG